LEADGNEIPAMQKRPLLHEDLVPDFEAFAALNRRRTEFGAIPFSEIRAYMKLHGIENYKDQQLFLKRIDILDNAYLKQQAKKPDGNIRN
jgi:hypothetical protein